MPSQQVNQKILKKKGLISLLLMLSMTAPLSIDMYLPSFPTLLEEFNTNSSVLNYTLVGFFVFFAIGMLLIGPISDKYGRRNVLLSSIVLYGIASGLCVFVKSVEVLIAFRILQAFGAGGMVAVSTAIVKDSFDDVARPKIIATIQMLTVFAPTLAPIIGAFIIRFSNWRATFVVLFGLAVLAFCFTLMFQETLEKENRLKGNVLQSLATLGDVAKKKAFMTFLILTALIYTIYMAFIAVSSYIYIDWFGLSETQYSLFFAFNSLILMLGPNVYIRVKDKIKPKKIVLFSLCTVLAAGIVTFFIGKISPFIFFFGFIPITFSNSFLRSFTVNMLLGQPNMNAGSTASVINFTTTALGSVGMVLGALAWSNYITGIGVIAMFAMSLSFILLYLFYKNGFKLKGLTE